MADEKLGEAVGEALTVPLRAVRRGDLATAGGKGANLGELVGAGFAVPPGFVVTTAAYKRLVDGGGLEAVIARALVDTPGDGAAVRAAFASAPRPPEVERAIAQAYEALGGGAVAVRSSATAEDLPEAAFAGQQDTYLNVVGQAGVLEAVARCWASLWNDRAMAYREQQRVDQQTVKLAVVVQRMAAAEAAGVMLTANPVSGARDEVVIEANPGLGEAVVSGEVTPDHFVLRRRGWGWQVAERRRGQREVVVAARAGGGIEHRAGEGAAGDLAVPDSALRRLARLGARIERHFGSPQDVEWAWAKGEVTILQARPMTALPAPPPRTNRLVRAAAGNFAEIMSVRPYPLDMTTWIPAVGGALQPMAEVLGLNWRLTGQFVEEAEVVTAFRTAPPRPTWKMLLAPAQLARRIRRYDPRRWEADPRVAEALRRARELEARDLRALDWAGLMGTVREAMAIPGLAGELRGRYFPGAAFAAARLRLLLGALGHGDRWQALLGGLDNKTLQANRALEELAERVRSDARLAEVFAAQPAQALWEALKAEPAGREFLAALRGFLDEYGHRETLISTARQPAWRTAPEQVLGLVKGLASTPPARPEAAPEWQTARDVVLRHPLLQHGPGRAAFLALLAKARWLLQIREDTHFYATLGLPVLQRAIGEAGRRLAEAGQLDSAEDIFHLRLEELERSGGPDSAAARELRAMAARKAKRAALAGKPLIDPRLFQSATAAGEALLRGMPGSPGVAEGPARIVRDSFEFDKLRPGDVLVAPYTNPAWTPLFVRAAAVVVDSGSAASHAAIVAREYGIPAVMSTVTATQTLRDGERVRVDGSQGAVYRAQPEAAGARAPEERHE